MLCVDQQQGDFGVCCAQAQDFEVAKADANSVDAHKQFVRGGLWEGQAFGYPATPQILQPCTIEVPAQVSVG